MLEPAISFIALDVETPAGDKREHLSSIADLAWWPLIHQSIRGAFYVDRRLSICAV